MLSSDEVLVYEFICKFFEKNGYSPSRKEICDGVYISNWSLQKAIDELKKKGKIASKKGSPRSIALKEFKLVRRV